jgi:hypothetical protein
VLRHFALPLGLIAASLCGCRSSAPTQTRDEWASSHPARSAQDSSSATSPAGSVWVTDAPEFDSFFAGLTPVCSRTVALLGLEGNWTKSYEADLPGVAPDVVETHFRARAKGLGLEVSSPIESLLVATTRGDPPLAQLDGSVLKVGVRLSQPDLEKELRLAASDAPPQLLELVAALGGAGALSQLKSAESASIGNVVLVELTRNVELTDQAVADLAKKSGLISKDAKAFFPPGEPAPNTWQLGLEIGTATVTVGATKLHMSDSPLCQDHAGRRAPQAPRTPEQQKKSDDDMLEEMMKGP